jgi:hypothetical protein
MYPEVIINFNQNVPAETVKIPTNVTDQINTNLQILNKLDRNERLAKTKEYQNLEK